MRPQRCERMARRLSVRTLFHFRSRFLYRLTPLHHFVLDERGELLRRRRRGITTFGFEALLHVLQLERLLDVRMADILAAGAVEGEKKP